MKKLTASVLALAMATSTAFAGGPVIVEEEPMVEAAKPRSGWIVPVVIGVILICAIACGDDDEEEVVAE
ncbi:hypothetical protein [Tabrizicola sp.]|uniref:hypothetical protein n=1 Tax=Tabrizicola sp. TaxID=2005166 RepID=UPI003F3F76EF